MLHAKRSRRLFSIHFMPSGIPFTKVSDEFGGLPKVWYVLFEVHCRALNAYHSLSFSPLPVVFAETMITKTLPIPLKTCSNLCLLVTLRFPQSSAPMINEFLVFSINYCVDFVYSMQGFSFIWRSLPNKCKHFLLSALVADSICNKPNDRTTTMALISFTQQFFLICIDWFNNYIVAVKI